MVKPFIRLYFGRGYIGRGYVVDKPMVNWCAFFFFFFFLSFLLFFLDFFLAKRKTTTISPGSLYHQPKQCIVVREISQNYHKFVLFKWVPFNDPCFPHLALWTDSKTSQGFLHVNPGPVSIINDLTNYDRSEPWKKNSYFPRNPWLIGILIMVCLNPKITG